jgi:hypothetical protein
MLHPVGRPRRRPRGRAPAPLPVVESRSRGPPCSPRWPSRGAPTSPTWAPPPRRGASDRGAEPARLPDGADRVHPRSREPGGADAREVSVLIGAWLGVTLLGSVAAAGGWWRRRHGRRGGAAGAGVGPPPPARTRSAPRAGSESGPPLPWSHVRAPAPSLPHLRLRRLERGARSPGRDPPPVAPAAAPVQVAPAAEPSATRPVGAIVRPDPDGLRVVPLRPDSSWPLRRGRDRVASPFRAFPYRSLHLSRMMAPVDPRD